MPAASVPSDHYWLAAGSAIPLVSWQTSLLPVIDSMERPDMSFVTRAEDPVRREQLLSDVGLFDSQQFEVQKRRKRNERDLQETLKDCFADFTGHGEAREVDAALVTLDTHCAIHGVETVHNGFTALFTSFLQEVKVWRACRTFIDEKYMEFVDGLGDLLNKQGAKPDYETIYGVLNFIRNRQPLLYSTIEDWSANGFSKANIISIIIPESVKASVKPKGDAFYE